ncbi:MAG: epimerase, partial [Acidiphilium sp. 37-67-22]
AANVTAARRVAEEAVARGVRRLVLVSSAAVFGRQRDGTFSEASPPRPDDAYAASKLEGEEAVRATVSGSATRLVIVRPCAVVGPGCAGNIPRLVRLVRRGMPLPFGAIANARSFIAVDDLAALIARAVAADDPPDCVIGAHPEPVSTPALIRALAGGLGRNVVLLPVPPSWLGAAARMAGQGELWRSFAGSFRADVALARDSLGFSAPTPMRAALEATAAALR